MITLVILITCALLTSIISAIAGMGGGILLLSAMTFFIPLNIIVPVHGFIQLVSNSSRLFYLREHINKPYLLYFTLGTPLGYFTAYKLLSSLSFSSEYYLVLAAFILYTVFKPKKMPQIKLKSFGWAVLGFSSVIQGAFIGATGPLIAPFFLRDDLAKEEIIATKAAQQFIIHLLKIPLFLSISFSYQEHSTLIISLSVAAVVGSYLGSKKLLNKIDDKIFKRIFKSVLFIAALRLIYKYVASL